MEEALSRPESSREALDAYTSDGKAIAVRTEIDVTQDAAVSTKSAQR